MKQYEQQKLKSLYDEDFEAWIAETIANLQSRGFDALDIEHLIEELTDLGKAEKNALRSNLKVLLAHLLKLHVQYNAPDTMKSSWYDSINEHRERVLDDLISTPSLKSYLDEAVIEVYSGARKLAIKDSKKLNLVFLFPKYPKIKQYFELLDYVRLLLLEYVEHHQLTPST